MANKQKYSKVILIIALALSVAIFTGCVKDGGNVTGATESGQGSGSTAPVNQTGMPIVSEPLELKIFSALNGKVASTLQSYGDIKAIKKIEEITGIKTSWMHPAVGQEVEQFNLMLASKELPDIIIWNFLQEKGGPTRFLSDEIIIKLNDLINNYAPNLKKILDDSPELHKQIILDDGTMFQFPAARINEETGKWHRMFGPIIRKDWLDNLGLKEPETIDELYVTLKEFKEKDANNNGDPNDELPFVSAKDNAFRFLLSAWGINIDFYVDNDKVKFGPIEPAYKDFLSTMNEWYTEELIDQEFPATDGKIFNAKVTGDQGGFFLGFAGGAMGTFLDLMKDSNTTFDLVALPWFVGPAGKPYTTHKDYIRMMSGGGAAVTTACKTPVEAVRFLDFIYSEEGHMLANFGIENESYTFVNGESIYTDAILNNPDGLPLANAVAMYCMSGIPFPMNKDPKAAQQTSWFWPQQARAHEIWDGADISIIFPEVTLTEDESAKATSVLGQANAYVTEMLTKFILGIEPLTNFDKYVENIEKMGIDEVIEINQAAMERYNKR